MISSSSNSWRWKTPLSDLRASAVSSSLTKCYWKSRCSENRAWVRVASQAGSQGRGIAAFASMVIKASRGHAAHPLKATEMTETEDRLPREVELKLHVQPDRRSDLEAVSVFR